MRPPKEFYQWLVAVTVKLDNDHNLDLFKAAFDGYFIENPTIGQETAKYFLRRYRDNWTPDEVSDEIAGAYEKNKLPGPKDGPGESHTPQEAPWGEQIVSADNNKGHRPTSCISCGSEHELLPVEPGFFKDAHLCRPCTTRAMELTEDKDR